jgi:hypothetical protein
MAALDVRYTFSGTAIANTDYAPVSGTAVIPAGSSQVDLGVPAIRDSLAETPETLIFTLAFDPAYDIGAANKATVNIWDVPVVSIVATDANAAEYPTTDKAKFRVSLLQTYYENFTSSYAVGGTATSGSDYDALPLSVVIAQGNTSKTITLTPKNDTLAEPAETVTLTLTGNAGGAPHCIGSPSSATATIADNDSTPPATPSNLWATSPSAGTVSLSWTDRSTNETRFEIGRGAAGISTTIVKTVGTNATGTSVNGLNSTTSYYWYVRACNASGCSPWHGPVVKRADGN